MLKKVRTEGFGHNMVVWGASASLKASSPAGQHWWAAVALETRLRHSCANSIWTETSYTGMDKDKILVDKTKYLPM